MQLIDNHDLNAANEAYKEKMEAIREEREDRILEYIADHPGETAYSLSKALDIPRSSMIQILDELEEDMEIKYVEEVESGRLKKKIYVRTLSDFTYTRFTKGSLHLPVVQKLIKTAQEKGEQIIIELENGDDQMFQPDEDILAYFDIS